MPCSVARRRRWRRRRRRLVALSFGSATAYMNTPHPHSLHSLSLSLSLSLWFGPRASLLIFLYRSNSSLSALSFVRCCGVCPRRTYARTIIRALRASTCTFTQIPHTRALRVYTERAETRERSVHVYSYVLLCARV